jgi:hypothetical protein
MLAPAVAGVVEHRRRRAGAACSFALVSQHAWSGVVAGTTRDSFWVSGKLSSVPCKPPVPLFRLYLFASVKNAFMSLTKAQATDWRAHCFGSFRA